MTRYPYVNEVLVLSFAIVLLLGSLLGIAIGLGLVFRRSAMTPLFARMNRWVSTRGALEFLEVPRGGPMQVSDIKRRWVTGLMSALGGAYLIVMFVIHVDSAKVSLLAGSYGRLAPLAAVLAEAMRWFFVVGGVVAVVVGILLLFFPRILIDLQARADRWYSTRQFALGGDAVHMPLDRLVERYPRAGGAILAALSIIPAIAAGLLLFGRF